MRAGLNKFAFTLTGLSTSYKSPQINVRCRSSAPHLPLAACFCSEAKPGQCLGEPKASQRVVIYTDSCSSEHDPGLSRSSFSKAEQLPSNNRNQLIVANTVQPLNHLIFK